MINVRRLLSLAAMCMFAGSIAASAEIYLTIDSIYGKAEVRKAGSDQWTATAKGAKLYNNDVIRVADSGSARFVWSNNSSSGYVRGGTQMLVNAYENPANKRTTQHLTVFFGAVFFLVKTALPQGLFGQEETKVFTPTTVIAIRGTAFDVLVNKDNGRTTVEVLNGTVLLRNIVRNVSSFVRAGHYSEVSLNTDPIVPAPIVDKSIAAIRKWVPSPVVDREMKSQTEKGKAQHDVIAGTTVPGNLVIVPLLNSSAYQGSWDLGQGFAALLAAQATKSAKGVTATVKGTAQSEPLALGAQEKAQYVLKGAVEDFDIVQRAKITAKADEYLEFTTAQVKLHLQLIDVSRNQLVYDNTYNGEVTGKHIPANGWAEVSKLTFSSADPKFSGTILGQAVSQAVEQSMQDMSRYIRSAQ